MPQDRGIHVTAQGRNEEQSLYQLNYVQSGGSLARWSDGRGLLGSVAILLLARLAMLWRQRRARMLDTRLLQR